MPSQNTKQKLKHKRICIVCNQPFEKAELLKLKNIIKTYYGGFEFHCQQYEVLYELMTHDKKNDSKAINFTLMADIGEIRINQTASKEEIFDCFDWFREN